jgi:hypothetical protein
MSPKVSLLLSCLVAAGGIAAPARAQSVPIDVRVSAVLGDPRGALRVGADGVTFDARDPKDSRRWKADDVRQLRIESSRRIVVETYQSRGWKGFGHSRTYEYRATAPITAEWVADVLSRTPRTVVTAIVPTRTTAAQFRVAVNHEGTDTRGTLALYPDGLAFETNRDGCARFWRFTDLDSVLRQDRFRLFIGAYEGSRENVRPFLFTLVEDLPPAFYDELWRRINGRHQTP